MTRDEAAIIAAARALIAASYERSEDGGVRNLRSLIQAAGWSTASRAFTKLEIAVATAGGPR